MLASSPPPDRAGTEQAAAAARVLAEAAAAAPNSSGEAVARAFLVAGAPRQLFALVSGHDSSKSSGGGGAGGGIRFACEDAIIALHSIAALIPDHIGDAAVDTRSLPALLAAAGSNGVTYSAAARAAACNILVAAAHCAENIAAMMHAGAGDRMVQLIVACGSAGNDPVGDAAADVIRRLISVGGARADAPATLVRVGSEMICLPRHPRYCRPSSLKSDGIT